MTSVANIIFCLNSENTIGNLSAMNILSVINPNYIPGLFSFDVIITFLGAENGKSVKVDFSDGNETIASCAIDSIPTVEGIDTNVPDEYRPLNLAINWKNVDFKKSGVYRLKYSPCQGHLFRD